MYCLDFLDATCLDILYSIVYLETTNQIVDSKIYWKNAIIIYFYACLFLFIFKYTGHNFNFEHHKSQLIYFFQKGKLCFIFFHMTAMMLITDLQFKSCFMLKFSCLHLCWPFFLDRVMIPLSTLNKTYSQDHMHWSERLNCLYQILSFFQYVFLWFDRFYSLVPTMDSKVSSGCLLSKCGSTWIGSFRPLRLRQT